jgi:hypothetical protein
MIFQDAVKLLHQVGELFWVVFLNDGLSEVLPCAQGIPLWRRKETQEVIGQ